MMPEYKIYNQKNMVLLATMADNSIDAIVTDCPYGLGKEPDAVETLQAWITTGYHEIDSRRKGKKNCAHHILRNAVIPNSNDLDTGSRQCTIHLSVSIDSLSVQSFFIQLNNQRLMRKEEVGNEGSAIRLEDMLMDKRNVQQSQAIDNGNFSLWPKKGFAACVGECGCFTKTSDTSFRIPVSICNYPFTQTETPSDIMAASRTEVAAVLTLDMTNMTANLLPASIAADLNSSFEIVSPELIAAFSGAGCLSSVTQSDTIRNVYVFANRTLTFNIITHKDFIDGFNIPNIRKKGFMGKEWDAFVPQPIFWKEVFRVLKPGGYVLAFFGTRTYDWGVMAVRLAGFEIRDCIQWIYGSGFPKSLAVDKALDKSFGHERERFENPNPISFKYDNKEGKQFNNEAISNEAITWQGYGTALKPAYEPICVARKPLDGTVANNVLKHECGALNLDGCRIGDDEVVSNAKFKGESFTSVGNGAGYNGKDETWSIGRFPANIILDEEAAAVLDEQTGTLTSGKPCGIRKADNNIYGHYAPGQEITGFGDSGGASRFFYCAKASKEDRNYGCEGLSEKQYSHDGRDKHIENAYQRHDSVAKNNHPTVKPITLMRYLVRLVKSPFDTCTIADFFTGSGTTGIACMLEGINFIGCDDDENSFNISKARVEYAKNDYLKEQLKPKQAKLFNLPAEPVKQLAQSELF